jgi:hypothetical protein
MYVRGWKLNKQKFQQIIKRLNCIVENNRFKEGERKKSSREIVSQSLNRAFHPEAACC